MLTKVAETFPHMNTEIGGNKQQPDDSFANEIELDYGSKEQDLSPEKITSNLLTSIIFIYRTQTYVVDKTCKRM